MKTPRGAESGEAPGPRGATARRDEGAYARVRGRYEAPRHAPSTTRGQIPVALPSSSEDRDPFAWLIDPLATAEFDRDYYEQRPCHIVRADADYYAGLLSIADLDAVLGTHNAAYPDISLVRGEDPIPRDAYTYASGRIDVRRAHKLFDEGATIVFGQLQQRLTALGELCSSIGAGLGSRLQTNIYLTPPDAQGFKPHWDTHDVFVLQISGRKHWTVYDSKVTLPLRGQEFDPGLHLPGPATDEFQLDSGSVVYIPRGVMHSARSSGEPSLHITLGVMAFTWTDFLLESVAATALQQESLRRSLPLCLGDDRSLGQVRERLARERLNTLVSCVPWSDVWQHFRNELSRANTPLIADGLGLRLAAGKLTVGSRVLHRAGLVVTFETRGTDCLLRFYGQELCFPVWMQPAVWFVSRTKVFTVSAVPDCLDADHKVAFVGRLIREGLLQLDGKREGA